jgi:ribosome maturation factor RimP
LKEVISLDLINRIGEIARPILDSMGLELVGVEYSGHGGRGRVRLFIDKAGGVTLDECEQASRSVSVALDVEDPIPVAYVLEVSSPGLDRPLKRREDFERCKGQRIKVRTSQAIEDRWDWTGRLQGLSDGQVVLLLAEGREMMLPLDLISSARIELEW